MLIDMDCEPTIYDKTWNIYCIYYQYIKPIVYIFQNPWWLDIKISVYTSFSILVFFSKKREISTCYICNTVFETH